MNYNFTEKLGKNANFLIKNSSKLLKKRISENRDVFNVTFISRSFRRNVQDVFDEEADLSGDDVGSDPDEDAAGDELDDYEPEEGDKDQIDEEQVRTEVVRHVPQT